MPIKWNFSSYSLVVVLIVVGFFNFVHRGAVEKKVLGISVKAPVRGEGVPVSETHVRQVKEPSLGKVSAASVLIFDKYDGEIIVAKNIDEKRATASLAKLMTALLSLEHLDLTAVYEMTEKDIEPTRPVIGFKKGEKIYGQDLLFAMLVGSTNDAALALGNALRAKQGKDISLQMNEKALELVMVNSRFTNPMGFDEVGNYSTAHDLKLLVEECFKHGLFEILGKNNSYEFTAQSGRIFRVKGTNKLLSGHADIEAVKTGSTPEAGGNMITQAHIKDHTVIIIVMGSQNREADTLTLKEVVSDSFIWEDQPVVK